MNNMKTLNIAAKENTMKDRKTLKLVCSLFALFAGLSCLSSSAGAGQFLINTEGSGAAQVGLRGTRLDKRGYVRQLGDLIVKINDAPIHTVNDLKDALEPHQANDIVRVTFVRDDQVFATNVTLRYMD